MSDLLFVAIYLIVGIFSFVAGMLSVVLFQYWWDNLRNKRRKK